MNHTRAIRPASHSARAAWPNPALKLALTVLALLPGACVSHVFRHAAPAVVVRVGLDAFDEDLLLVNVVHGLYPRHQNDFVIAVPHGWQAAPVEARPDGCDILTPPLALALTPRNDYTVSERQQRFAYRNTSAWSADTRRRHALVEPDELPEAERRSYEVVNLRRPDGSVDLEVRGHRPDGRVRVLGVVPLPAQVTPRELSTGELVLLTPTLAVVDAAFVPLTAAAFVVLIPFGSPYYLLAGEPDTLPGS